jgi:hypothetical protein
LWGEIEKKMRRWVLAIAILAAALLLGAEAQAVQQGHQTERISGEGPFFSLCSFPSRF